jgi:putative ABC transport system permease protein
MKYLFRSRTRSALTVLSIAASFCMLGILLAMYWMFFVTPAPPDSALRLIVRNRISFTHPIPVFYAKRVQSLPGVRYVMKYQWFGGTYKDQRNSQNIFPRFGIEADKLFRIHPEYSIASEEQAAFVRQRNSCVLGRPLAQRLNVGLGDHVLLTGDIFPANLDLVVRGLYDAPRDDENLFFHFDYMNEIAFRGKWQGISMLSVMVDSPQSADSVAKAIDAMFRNSTNQTKTETEQGLVLGFIGYMGNVKLFLMAFCFSLSLATLFVSANTMAMSVRERVSDVGILKTLGFSQGFLLRLFVGESLAMSLSGCILGLLAAQVVVEFLRRIPIIFVDLKALFLAPDLALVAISLAAVLGILSSAVPAWAASRRSIRECLTLTE